MTAGAGKGADKPTKPDTPPPTVGRIVHYYDRTDSAPLAGMVAAVFDDGVVNLAVVNGDGTTGPRLKVPHHDGGSSVQAHSWRWPARA